MKGTVSGNMYSENILKVAFDSEYLSHLSDMVNIKLYKYWDIL